MRLPIEVNRHRGLALDELTRKYRQARHAARDEDAFHDDPCEDYDDYWDPRRGQTADDYLILEALEESIGFLCRKPRLGELLPGSLARPSPAEPAPPEEARPPHGPEDLADALYTHVQRLLDRARSHQFAYTGDLEDALVRVNGGVAGVESALSLFEARPGPLVMALLFTPFWVRPLASWRPPRGNHAALARSLIEHLFQIYSVPSALQQPWLGEGLPGLKWALWLILLGQGGNLHRGARRFGWSIAKRFTHCFSSAPEGITALEACMWSEVVRLGGNRIDFDRVRDNPAYALDPTETPGGVLDQPAEEDSASSWERQRESGEILRMRAFWQETVEWLIRYRDHLTDDSSACILEWAMHHYTESVRGWGSRAPFSWRGRDPSRAHAAALEYRRQRDTPYADLTWKARGLDWQSSEGETIAWNVKELTSSRELAEESHAMHHCVASYAYRCAQGHSAIFSLSAAGIRRITVELDPSGHRIVQARGACNRAVTSDEQAVLARWLTATWPQSLHIR